MSEVKHLDIVGPPNPGHKAAELERVVGKTRLSIGEPTWKMLDRRSVETLIEQEV